MTPDLPPLPEPYTEQVIEYSGIAVNRTDRFPLFTADQLRAYAAEAVRLARLQALEDAANVAESWADYRHPTASIGPRIARAIRQLKDRT